MEIFKTVAENPRQINDYQAKIILALLGYRFNNNKANIIITSDNLDEISNKTLAAVIKENCEVVEI